MLSDNLVKDIVGSSPWDDSLTNDCYKTGMELV